MYPYYVYFSDLWLIIAEPLGYHVKLACWPVSKNVIQKGTYNMKIMWSAIGLSSGG